jgi:SH3 domain protein
MMRAAVRTILVCACALGLDAGAETRYISDVLYVPLRSGPSGEHRIIHYGLPSGTAFEVLGEDESAKFTQVRTENGSEGWVPTQYLVNEPIASARLAQAEAEIERLESLLAGDTSTLAAELEDARNEAARNAESAETVRELEAELAEIRRVSASAVATQQENLKLSEANAELRRERDDLVAQTEQLQGDVELRWMLVGGGMVLGGLLIGVWVGSRSRRRRSW